MTKHYHNRKKASVFKLKILKVYFYGINYTISRLGFQSFDCCYSKLVTENLTV